MQWYFCKCRETRSYGSMGPDPCQKCEKCGTHPTLNGIGQPAKPVPHAWVKTEVDTDEGLKTLTVCSYCGIKK